MTHTHPGTPAEDGFRMPGEFEPHAGCWMLWPERPDNWREAARPAQLAFAQVAAAIAQFEPVTVGASAGHYEAARALLPARVRLVEMAHDDAWMRDVGPTCVVNGRGAVRGVDWHFNAWGGLNGGLYFPWDQDDLVARKVLETERLLGVSQIIWLGRGVVNDETSGHIDELACFVRPGVVCLAWTDRRRDPQYAISLDAFERLQEARDARDRRLEVVRLPMPGPLYMRTREAAGVIAKEGSRPRVAGERLAASYVNFYIANGGIVMPLLDARTDARAAARLKRLFPGRRVVGVPTREVLLGGGNIHCITQQIPSGTRSRSPSAG